MVRQKLKIGGTTNFVDIKYAKNETDRKIYKLFADSDNAHDLADAIYGSREFNYAEIIKHMDTDDINEQFPTLEKKQRIIDDYNAIVKKKTSGHNVSTYLRFFKKSLNNSNVLWFIVLSDGEILQSLSEHIDDPTKDPDVGEISTIIGNRNDRIKKVFAVVIDFQKNPDLERSVADTLIKLHIYTYKVKMTKKTIDVNKEKYGIVFINRKDIKNNWGLSITNIKDLVRVLSKGLARVNIDPDKNATYGNFYHSLQKLKSADYIKKAEADIIKYSRENDIRHREKEIIDSTEKYITYIKYTLNRDPIPEAESLIVRARSILKKQQTPKPKYKIKLSDIEEAEKKARQYDELYEEYTPPEIPKPKPKPKLNDNQILVYKGNYTDPTKHPEVDAYKLNKYDDVYGIRLNFEDAEQELKEIKKDGKTRLGFPTVSYNDYIKRMKEYDASLTTPKKKEWWSNWIDTKCKQNTRITGHCTIDGDDMMGMIYTKLKETGGTLIINYMTAILIINRLNMETNTKYDYRPIGSVYFTEGVRTRYGFKRDEVDRLESLFNPMHMPKYKLHNVADREEFKYDHKLDYYKLLNKYRAHPSSSYLIIRRYNPSFSNIPDEHPSPTKIKGINEALKDLKNRYFKNNRWTEKWAKDQYKELQQKLKYAYYIKSDDKPKPKYKIPLSDIEEAEKKARQYDELYEEYTPPKLPKPKSDDKELKRLYDIHAFIIGYAQGSDDNIRRQEKDIISMSNEFIESIKKYKKKFNPDLATNLIKRAERILERRTELKQKKYQDNTPPKPKPKPKPKYKISKSDIDDMIKIKEDKKYQEYTPPEIPKPKPKPKPKYKISKSDIEDMINRAKDIDKKQLDYIDIRDIEELAKSYPDDDINYNEYIKELEKKTPKKKRHTYKESKKSITMDNKKEKIKVDNGNITQRDYVKLFKYKPKKKAAESWFKTRDTQEDLHKKISIRLEVMIGKLRSYREPVFENGKYIRKIIIPTDSNELKKYDYVVNEIERMREYMKKYKLPIWGSNAHLSKLPKAKRNAIIVEIEKSANEGYEDTAPNEKKPPKEKKPEPEPEPEPEQKMTNFKISDNLINIDIANRYVLSIQNNIIAVFFR